MLKYMTFAMKDNTVHPLMRAALFYEGYYIHREKQASGL